MENHDFSRLIPRMPKLSWFKSRKVKYFLHLFNPLCILRNERTMKAWDRHLRDLLENPKSITRRSEHVVMINGEAIWVSNWPYAYGSPREHKWLPSRRTAAKLKMIVDALDEKLSEERYK